VCSAETGISERTLIGGTGLPNYFNIGSKYAINQFIIQVLYSDDFIFWKNMM